MSSPSAVLSSPGGALHGIAEVMSSNPVNFGNWLGEYLSFVNLYPSVQDALYIYRYKLNRSV